MSMKAGSSKSPSVKRIKRWLDEWGRHGDRKDEIHSFTVPAGKKTAPVLTVKDLYRMLQDFEKLDTDACYALEFKDWS